MQLLTFATENIAMIALLFAAMLFLQALGKRAGLRAGNHSIGVGVSETAVFGLLGLVLGFTFSGAIDRFDARRLLIIDEANAVGTAWMRLDVVPGHREALRDLVRQYLDLRLEAYRLAQDKPAALAVNAKALAMQQRIWTEAVSAVADSPRTTAGIELLPALNDMFDIATKRSTVAVMHPPPIVFVMLAVLALIGAVYAGYALAARERPSIAQTMGYPVMLAMVFFVIVELEFPRKGLVRLDAADQVLIDVRRSMDP